MSVAGRRCGQASSHGELSWRRTRRDCFLFLPSLPWLLPGFLHGFSQRFALCDSSGIDPEAGVARVWLVSPDIGEPLRRDDRNIDA